MRGTVSFSQSIIHVGLFQASSSKHLSKLYKLQPFVDLTNGSKLGNKVQILTKNLRNEANETLLSHFVYYNQAISWVYITCVQEPGIKFVCVSTTESCDIFL